MAGSYTFDAWSVADLGDFERHYSNSLSKLTGEDAKLISNFDAMKGLMRKYDAVELMRLHPHLVGINPMNRDEKLMSAAEMSAKGAKIVNVGASRDLCDFNRAWATQDDPVKRESWNWTVKTAAISDHFGKPSMSIAFGSIGCSHWNQFLHAVNCESPTSAKLLKDRRGFIDKTKIFGNDKCSRRSRPLGCNGR